MSGGVSEHPVSGARVTIGQLAERTGVPVATLRTWESRYGAPRPRRQAGGHRRYDDSDVVLVREILRLRSSGLSLAAAVAHARSADAQPEPSLFATLRGRHPGLQPRTLKKRSLLALTRAVEDECCAQAVSPLLFAGFQRQRFYWASHARWVELARTSSLAVMFADFAEDSTTGEEPVRLRLPRSAPLRREWLLVCDSPDRPACVSGWELPGQQGTPDSQRRFETLWTVDARVVREAARVCAGMAASLSPQTAARFGDRLAETPPEASLDLGRAQRLFERVVGYLDGV